MDRRTWLSRFIEQTEDILASDQGGHEKLTHREGMTVTLAANLWTEWQLLSWYRQQAILKGELSHDSDKYYLSLANTLRRTLETLGLRPERSDKLPSLQEYLAARSASRNQSAATVSVGTAASPTPAATRDPTAAASEAPTEDGDNPDTVCPEPPS